MPLLSLVLLRLSFLLLIPLNQLLRPAVLHKLASNLSQPMMNYRPIARETSIISSSCNFHILSTRVPFTRLGFVCPILTVRAKLPGNGDNAKDNGTGNDGVASPVSRLSIPTTGRRPDVLGVTVSVYPYLAACLRFRAHRRFRSIPGL